MFTFKLLNLLAILAILSFMENALAGGKPKPDGEEESSHSKKAGHSLGKAFKNIEHAYKETIVEPSKDLAKGVKEGKKEEKGKRD